MPTDPPPAQVPQAASPAGDVRSRWAWTHPAVWTDRMLTALEDGVKGSRWYSLIDKVHALPTLHAAFVRVKANHGSPGVDHVTVEAFEAQLDSNLVRLARALRNGTYRPQAIRRTWIDKPGGTEKRPLGIPTVRDRVVQTALRMVLEPIFERDFARYSFGFRPLRGCKDALRRVDYLLRLGYVFVVDADLKSYFDTIPHEALMALIRAKVSDSRVLALIEDFLKQDILDDLATWTPETGTPQGAVISPLLSNIYLDALDHLMATEGFAMTRYADDFVVHCRTSEEAERALALVASWTRQADLTLHPTKTHIVDERERGGFDFLGYHFERGFKWPRTKSMPKLKDTIRAKTPRLSGKSLDVIIADVNRSLRGWSGYFKDSLKTTFKIVDGMVRRRLRRILRKRLGRKKHRRRYPPNRGHNNQRWPNAFFADHGLFSLLAAHAQASQSS